jgi:hypothetical protein
MYNRPGANNSDPYSGTREAIRWGRAVNPDRLHLPYPPNIHMWPGVFLFICNTGVWTQDFPFSRQVLYCLSHTSSPFCFSNFSDRVLHFFTPLGLASNQDPPPYPSHIAPLAYMIQHTWLIFSDGGPTNIPLSPGLVSKYNSSDFFLPSS